MAYNTTLTGFLNVCKTIINDIVRSLNNDELSTDCIDASVCRLNALWRNVQRMAHSFIQCQQLLPELQRMINIVEDKQRSQLESTGIRLEQVRTGGRPRYYISRDHLLFFVEMGFSAKHISKLLHISRSSVLRRLRSFGISLRRRYSDISDSSLDDRVKLITQHNRSLGQRLVQGMLSAEGILVQRSRIAQSLIRVDEAGVAMRWCRTVKRRTYSVSGPNALWHIDGNHKLIRWGMVIHGGIDGFSRMVVFMDIALDNTARTAVQPFLKACNEFGVPSRVRTDHGFENLDIAAFMLAHRGENRGSIITGRSVHNQRIERLWRDLFQSCTHVFYQLFYFLERRLLLDVSNPIHLWCLQYIYKPCIQAALDVFRQAWNNHSLRTENGQTPRQIFVSKIFEQVGRGHRGIDDLFENQIDDINVHEYGIDYEGPVPQETNNLPVVVPRTPCPLSVDRFDELRRNVNPLDNENELGIDLYLRTLEFCSDIH